MRPEWKNDWENTAPLPVLSFDEIDAIDSMKGEYLQEGTAEIEGSVWLSLLTKGLIEVTYDRRTNNAEYHLHHKAEKIAQKSREAKRSKEF